MILGLDISTSIIGYTILDEANTIIECDCIRLEKFKDFFIKAKNTKNKLNNLAGKYDITEIGRAHV